MILSSTTGAIHSLMNIASSVHLMGSVTVTLQYNKETFLFIDLRFFIPQRNLKHIFDFSVYVQNRYRVLIVRSSVAKHSVRGVASILKNQAPCKECSESYISFIW